MSKRTERSVGGSVEMSHRFIFVQVVVGWFEDRLGDVRRVTEYIPIPAYDDPTDAMHMRTCSSKDTGAQSGNDLKSLFERAPAIEEHIDNFMESLVKRGYLQVELFTHFGGLFSRAMTTSYALNWQPYVGQEFDGKVCELVRQAHTESVAAGTGVALITSDQLEDLEIARSPAIAEVAAVLNEDAS